MRWKPIKYRDFWDQPRIFFVEDAGNLFLFDCKFDSVVEDFADSYQVYLMPPLSAADYEASWEPLWQRAIQHLGEIALSEVTFDPTRRQAVDIAVLDRFAVPAQSSAGITPVAAGE